MGPVETSLRSCLKAETKLSTPARNAPFTVKDLSAEGLVLLLGQKQAWTLIPWNALEQIPSLIRERGGRIKITGTGYSTDIQPGTLDGLLKSHVKRATAGWVSAVLQHCGIVVIDSSRPMTIRIDRDWNS